MESSVVSGILAIILGLALVSNYYLFTRARKYYLQLGQLRLDPLGLDESSDPRLPVDRALSTGRIPPIVVFFGDSRIETWPPPPSLDWVTFVNRGITAQTTAQIIRRFNDHVRPLRPRVVVVQTGINDLNLIPIFPARKGIIARCQENIDQIAHRCRELGAAVVLTTIFPYSQIPFPRRLAWSRDVAAAIDEVNAHIRVSAAPSPAARPTVVFDAHAILADDAGVTWPEYRQDPFHINAAGYRALNDAFGPLLATLLIAQGDRIPKAPP